MRYGADGERDHSRAQALRLGLNRQRGRLRRVIKSVTDNCDRDRTSQILDEVDGFRSRRIDDTNRLVYAVDKVFITVISCRYHY